MKIFLCAIIGASFILGACSSSDSNDAPPATTEVEIPIETPEEEVTETPVVVEPTPTAEIVIPTPAPLIHTVQPGNSLSQIAQSYGVPIELLAAEKPMLLIPLLKGSRGDQVDNALNFQKNGWAEIQIQANLLRW